MPLKPSCQLNPVLRACAVQFERHAHVPERARRWRDPVVCALLTVLTARQAPSVEITHKLVHVLRDHVLHDQCEVVVGSCEAQHVDCASRMALSALTVLDLDVLEGHARNAVLRRDKPLESSEAQTCVVREDATHCATVQFTQHTRELSGSGGDARQRRIEG